MDAIRAVGAGADLAIDIIIAKGVVNVIDTTEIEIGIGIGIVVIGTVVTEIKDQTVSQTYLIRLSDQTYPGEAVSRWINLLSEQKIGVTVRVVTEIAEIAVITLEITGLKTEVQITLRPIRSFALCLASHSAGKKDRISKGHL
tara:strand:+ start:1557 stop:1985 length:429 start_codon:yes stop_codon:yes gene_type:complete